MRLRRSVTPSLFDEETTDTLLDDTTPPALAPSPTELLTPLTSLSPPMANPVIASGDKAKAKDILAAIRTLQTVTVDPIV